LSWIQLLERLITTLSNEGELNISIDPWLYTYEDYNLVFVFFINNVQDLISWKVIVSSLYFEMILSYWKLLKENLAFLISLLIRSLNPVVLLHLSLLLDLLEFVIIISEISKSSTFFLERTLMTLSGVS
jgi:hypothetical protein